MNFLIASLAISSCFSADVSVGSSVVGGNLTINATPETGITGTITYKFLRTEVSWLVQH